MPTLWSNFSRPSLTLVIVLFMVTFATTMQNFFAFFGSLSMLTAWIIVCSCSSLFRWRLHLLDMLQMQVFTLLHDNARRSQLNCNESCSTHSKRQCNSCRTIGEGHKQTREATAVMLMVVASSRTCLVHTNRAYSRRCMLKLSDHHEGINCNIHDIPYDFT